METSIVKRLFTRFVNTAGQLKLLSTLCLFLIILASPLGAQEKEDSVFTFRFEVGKDGFYGHRPANEKELARMYECVERYRPLIVGRENSIYVDGYSSSRRSHAENLVMARTRSNRVKSELITLKGLREEDFVTRNHVGEGEFVTVRITLPKDRLREDSDATVCPEPVAEAPLPVAVSEYKTTDRAAVFTDSVPSLEAPADTVAGDSVVTPVRRERPDSRFALKTNLLFYAALMPNVEVEWKVARRWSVALEGQMAWYSKTPPHKVYRIATVIPEVRFWPVERSRWHGMYVGLFGGLGLYDLHKGYEHKGHEGEGYMVGASVGYMWPIGRHLSLDAGLGAGFLRARDKVYAPFDGHYLYQYTKTINYFGPLRLKLSLVWRIPW